LNCISGCPTSSILAHASLEQEIRYCSTIDGVRLAYAKVGTGPPLVRPAHWLGHLEYDWELPFYRHLLLGLAREFTLIRYDARGNGLSDWDVGELSLDAWVSDLETVVDAAGLTRFPLLALSQGCACHCVCAQEAREGGPRNSWRRRKRTSSRTVVARRSTLHLSAAQGPGSCGVVSRVATTPPARRSDLARCIKDHLHPGRPNCHGRTEGGHWEGDLII
jgi:pimeloyl-ACP methyl ester carboxylesterase